MGWFSAPSGTNKTMYLFLALLTLGSTISTQGWTLLYTNFAVEAGGFDGAQIGMVQSLREIPGFLGFTVVWLLLLFREHRLASLSVIVSGIGVSLTGFFPSFWPIVGATMLMSVGFHYFETLNQSLMIQYYDIARTPLVMGKLRGLAAGGSLIVSIFVFLCADMLNFQWLFLSVGMFSLLLGLWSLTMDPSDSSLPTQRKKLIARSRYWLFYVLTLLMGGRRMMFSVFALFLLVERFDFSVQTVSMLFMFNYAINWFLNPMVGRIIARFGERRLLSVEYICAIAVFFGYATTNSTVVVCVLYVLDSITFNFAIAVRTFFQKIADPADVAPSMGLAQTINHISAVLIPAFGGWLWVTLGYHVLFWFGAGLAVLSLLFVQRIDAHIAVAQKRRPQ